MGQAQPAEYLINVSRRPHATLSLSRWLTDNITWPDAVLPDYDGGSIGNLSTSILATLDAAPPTAQGDLLPPLHDDILSTGLLNGARTVVLLVVDGLGTQSLRWARSRGAVKYLDTAQTSSQLTSVFPSTTAAALTTLHTGVSPAHHQMAGYTMYLSEQQATVNVVAWKPVGGMATASDLPEPRDFLPVPSIHKRLERAGIPSVLVSNLAFMDSALTNVQSAGVPYQGHRTPAEFAGLLLREARRPGPRLVFGYWDGFDALSHTHGPESDIALNEIRLLDSALGKGFFDLISKHGGDVAVILTADHGHAPISRSRTHSLGTILKRSSPHRPIPTGDRRAVGLAFDGDEARAALRKLAGDDGIVLPVRDALDAGLYGPGGDHQLLEDRIGKTLLLARQDAAFVFPQSSNPTAGGHGSLTAREMLVPLLGWRF